MSPREMTPEQLLDEYDTLITAPIILEQSERLAALRAEIIHRLCLAPIVCHPQVRAVFPVQDD